MRSLLTRVLLGLCLGLFGCARPAAAPATHPVERAGRENVEEPRRGPVGDSDDRTSPDADGLGALHRAAARGDAAAVGQILESGGDGNERGPRGLTPLHATMVGAFEDAMNRSMAPPGQAEEWSVAKARARERETRGRRDPVRGPMQFVEVTRLLLAHGADARAATAEGLTPLHVAAQTRNADLVRLLIAAQADVNAVHRPRGLVEHTPLVDAAGGGNVDVVRALLDAGADPAKVPEAARPYFVNIAMSDMSVFRLLLDRGLKLPPGALKTATRNGRVEAAAEIIRRGKAADHDAALYTAITASQQEELTAEEEDRLVRTVRLLLEAGASPSAPEQTGEALVAAVARGRAKVVQLLRERGAKIDWARLKNDEHRPPFIAYAAALENRVDRLREFEALGMPLDALGAAVLGRAERLAALIASREAEVAGEAGSTALFFAARFGHVDCVRVLLGAKTDPNARLPSWDTPDIGPRPLAGAAGGGHVAVVRLLLERGADPALVELSDEELAKLRPEIRDLLERKQGR